MAKVKLVRELRCYLGFRAIHRLTFWKILSKSFSGISGNFPRYSSSCNPFLAASQPSLSGATAMSRIALFSGFSTDSTASVHKRTIFQPFTLLLHRYWHENPLQNWRKAAKRTQHKHKFSNLSKNTSGT